MRLSQPRDNTQRAHWQMCVVILYLVQVRPTGDQIASIHTRKTTQNTSYQMINSLANQWAFYQRKSQCFWTKKLRRAFSLACMIHSNPTIVSFIAVLISLLLCGMFSCFFFFFSLSHSHFVINVQIVIWWKDCRSIEIKYQTPIRMAPGSSGRLSRDWPWRFIFLPSYY